MMTPGARPQRPGDLGPGSESDPMNLLIIDDEQEILHMLRRNFEPEGYRVTVTTNPLEALELMKLELFNLILTDIKMPEMSGVEVLRQVKKINPLANVIMMTGYSSMDKVVDCLSHGAVDYFTKPIKDLNALLESINQARARVIRWRSAMGVNMRGLDHDQ